MYEDLEKYESVAVLHLIATRLIKSLDFVFDFQISNLHCLLRILSHRCSQRTLIKVIRLFFFRTDADKKVFIKDYHGNGLLKVNI